MASVKPHIINIQYWHSEAIIENMVDLLSDERIGKNGRQPIVKTKGKNQRR
jgi:hypothetical protein